MKLHQYIDMCRMNGRYSFSIEEVEKALELPKIQALNAIRRLKLSNLIVSPAKGFYLIVPPEYQAFNCLPADMFIPDLMQYLHQPYYVGYLSAAQFYGAAHQKPQQFQVVIPQNRRPIYCGRIVVNFIKNKNASLMPTNKFNTVAGTIAVAAPEVIAADLVTNPQYGAGINNVATVLNELAEKIDHVKLIKLTSIHQELFWIQRLGYLLDTLGFHHHAEKLLLTLKNKKLNWAKLVSNASYKNLSRNNKWKIIVNTEVEIDS